MNKNFSRTMKLALVLGTLLLTMTSVAIATPSEAAPIWRAQLRVQVANVEDAGTDDGLRVRLNYANSTWLDTGRDDFERNSAYTYDLKLDGLKSISDISYLSLDKEGSDGLGLKSFTLYINGRAIYTQVFPSVYWLDNEDGHVRYYNVSRYTLRADDAWLAYVQPLPPFVITHTELERRLTGLIGDMMHSNPLQWGPKYGYDWVEVTKQTNATNTLHVDLDLELSVNHWFNPEVDVDFDVQVSCQNNKVKLTVLNPRVVVDSSWYSEVLSLGIIEFLDSYLTDKMTEGIQNIPINQNVPVPVCPVITIGAAGDIIFSLPTPTTRTTTIPTGILTLQKTAEVSVTEAETHSLNAAAVEPIALEEAAPLSVNVALADEIKADAETTYTLSVKSNRNVASHVEIELTLPQLMNASETIVEVEGAQGKRHIGLQPATGAQGESVLRFNDCLEADVEQRYILRVRFLTGTQADLQLTATVTDTDSAASVKSTTYLKLADGFVKPRGTFQAARGLTVERAQAPTIRKR